MDLHMEGKRCSLSGTYHFAASLRSALESKRKAPVINLIFKLYKSFDVNLGPMRKTDILCFSYLKSAAILFGLFKELKDSFIQYLFSFITNAIDDRSFIFFSQWASVTASFVYAPATQLGFPPTIVKQLDRVKLLLRYM